MDWKNWDAERPEAQRKIVLVCDDGASAMPARTVMDDDTGAVHALHGEDGSDLCAPGMSCMRGALWAYLPESSPLAFMEAHGD